MPYAVDLKSIPRLPAAQSAFVNADGTPTKEFYSLLTALRALLETYEAALEEVEP